MAQKVIITNFGALKAKYGSNGLKNIQKALKTYIQADSARQINTIVVAVDEVAKTKAKIKRKKSMANEERWNKNAIDKIYAKEQPDYLVILGSIDVIPHQSLRNPVFSSRDIDESAPSDLPYACDAPYSDEPGDFNAPTRVVGRIPDITGSNDEQYLVDLLSVYSKWTQRPPASYSSFLGLTALVWQVSTKQSLKNIFGNSTTIQTSPKAGPNWTKPIISCLAHFINCHGSNNDPRYYGQKGNDFPPAHEASFLDATPNLLEGTIVAAECCYGAQLYDPQKFGGQSGICNTYLKRKAYAVFGSSTIAYGPADSNSDADLICQYFLKHVLTGSSTGRAALEARIDFIKGSGLLDPVNLKTLAQFNLMGDPSVVPVASPKSERAPSTMRGAKGTDFEQIQRRLNLKAVGEALAYSVPVAKAMPISRGGNAGLLSLSNLLKREKVTSPNVMSFQIFAPDSPLFRSTAKHLSIKMGRTEKPLPNRVHVVFEGETIPKRSTMKEKTSAKTPPNAMAIVAWERDNEIISYRKVFQHSLYLRHGIPRNGGQENVWKRIKK